MAVGGIGDYQVSDPIKEYQQLSAIIEDRYAPEFEYTAEPARSAGRPTLGALQGDDYPIEMDADGYPIMPACLQRS